MKKIAYFMGILSIVLLYACGGSGNDDPVIEKDYFELSPNTTIGAGGDTKTLEFRATKAWEAEVSGDWLTITPMKGNGSTNGTIKLELSAGANNTGKDRIAVITVTMLGKSPKKCTVTQSGDNSIETENPTLSPNTTTIVPEGETKTLTLTASKEWKASVSDNWLSITPESGNGSTNITMTAGPNDTGNDRTAIIKVTMGNKSATCSVSQASIPEKLNVNVSELSFKASGDTKTFSITSNTDWTITSPEWCKLSVTSGKNDGNVSIVVGENESIQERDGTITIKGNNKSANINVKQSAGSLATISSFSKNGQSFTYNYSSELSIKELGVCYSTSDIPTVNDNKIMKSTNSNSGDVTITITDVKKNTTYNVRAYVINAVGIAYSNILDLKVSSEKPEEGDNQLPQAIKRK